MNTGSKNGKPVRANLQFPSLSFLFMCEKNRALAEVFKYIVFKGNRF